MKKILRQVAIICASTAFLSPVAFADGTVGFDDNKIYFGIEGGYSAPAKGKFKDEGAVGKLKGTGVIEGKVGYMFYPGIAVEVAYGYRPNYDLKLEFPDQSALGLSDFRSKVKVASHSVLVSLVYFAQPNGKFTPYFTVGAGYAHVTPKYAKIDAMHPSLGRIKVGYIKKHVSERIAIRGGAGVLTELTPNLHLTTGVKLEVVNKIGLHADFINPGTGAFVRSSSLKKTIGVVEFTAGLRVSL